MDPLTLLAGGGLVLAGALVGHAIRPRPPRSSEPLPPECSCEHGYGQHEQAGKCVADMRRPSRWSATGSFPIDYEWVPCTCLSYDGPEPLPRVWTPGGMA